MMVDGMLIESHTYVSRYTMRTVKRECTRTGRAMMSCTAPLAKRRTSGRRLGFFRNACARGYVGRRCGSDGIVAAVDN